MAHKTIWTLAGGASLASPESLESLKDVDPLAGPYCSPNRVSIDPVFGKSVDLILRAAGEELEIDALVADIGLDHSPTSPLSVFTREKLSPQLSILETSENQNLRIIEFPGAVSGMVALERISEDEERIRGIFFGPDLSVCPLYQNNGIGSALVAATLLVDGSIPTWDHDKPGYSPSGAWTVQKGLDLANELSAHLLELLKEEDTPCL